MNKSLMKNAFILILIGFLIFMVGSIGRSAASGELTDAEEEWYEEASQSFPDRDELEDIVEEFTDAKHGVNTWTTVADIGTAIIYLGALFAVYSIVQSEFRKRLYYPPQQGQLPPQQTQLPPQLPPPLPPPNKEQPPQKENVKWGE